MKITINDQRKVFAIQEEFSNVYPYLKLEFLSKPHEPGGGSSGKIIKHSGKTLGECRTIHRKGSLTITPQMKVSDLEQNFRDVYGLGVKVFRKSGKSWLEITTTDDWSLEEQNRQGEALCKSLQA